MSQPVESTDLMETVNGMLSDLCIAFETDQAIFMHSGFIEVGDKQIRCEIEADLRTGAIAIHPKGRVTQSMRRKIREPTRQKELAIVLIEQGLQLIKNAGSTGPLNCHFS